MAPILATVFQRDAATGEIKTEFRESSGSIERLAFSSDGQRLASVER